MIIIFLILIANAVYSFTTKRYIIFSGSKVAPDHDGDEVVIDGVILVAEELAHEHDGRQLEALEEHLRWEANVL